MNAIPVPVGYGVMVDEKPAGLWPISLDCAQRAAERYRERKPGAVVDVVEVLAAAVTRTSSHASSGPRDDAKARILACADSLPRASRDFEGSDGGPLPGEDQPA